MKSIERRFKGISARHPAWSTYTCFAEAILGTNFTLRIIKYWFNRLVDKKDYDTKDKKRIVAHLISITKPRDEGINQS